MSVGRRFLCVAIVAACALIWENGSARAVAQEAKGAQNGDVQDLLYLAPKRPIVIRLHIRVDGQPLTEMRAAIARAIFDALDADSNGVLEGSELAGIPSTELLTAAAKGAGKKAAASPNRPNDLRKQHVTADELTAQLLPSIGNPFAIVVETGAKPAVNSAAERLKASPYGSPQSDSLEMSSLLAILDANGDGRVTLDECTRVDELFHLLDLNDDETISRTELAQVAAAKNSSRKGAPTPLSNLAGLLEPIDRQGTEEGLARKLVEKYGRTSPALAATRLGDPTPGCELDVALPKKLLERPFVALHAGSAPIEDDSIGLGAAKTDEMLLRLGPLPIELQAAESPPRPVSQTAYAKALFKRADRDNNDYLDASEFAGTNLGLGPDEFKAIDRDHNGMIFEEEWVAFMTVYQIVADHRVTLTIAGAATDPIAQFDSNGDGRLTHNEWVRALATIRSWDTNHDGEISPDEIPRRFVGTFHLGTLSPAGNQSMAPMRGMTSPPAAAAGSAPAWFQKMDRNRDGEVSLREFLGPISVFRRLDANHDGYLQPDEARQGTE
jgi:Ca2+-binding EF-hand superfamily protein